VKRIGRLNAEQGRYTEYTSDDGEVHQIWKDKVCLMGADERWRWTARAEGISIIGCGEETDPPPCRCEGCKKHGILRIDH